MSTGLTIAGFCLTLLTSIIIVTTVIVQMKTHVATLSKEADKREEREEKASSEVHEFFVLLKSFIAAQTEINKAVEVSLISTTNKLQDLQHQIVENSQVRDLLIEALKRRGVAIEP